jgi:hypothetical protein
MNGKPSRIPALTGRTGGAVALLVAAAFAGSAFAASTDSFRPIGALQLAADATPAPEVTTAPAVMSAPMSSTPVPLSATPAPASAKQVSATAPAAKAGPLDRVEGRIKDLHEKLKITRSQEDLWSKVGDSMRATAQEMEPLVKARSEHAKAATAIEDLNSFSQLADAHADGLKQFVTVFAPLYASMSDVQKQNADTVFRGHGHSQAQ